MKPNSEIVDDLVERIVESAHPVRILLFGSAARGEIGQNSDLDVLVIVPDGIHRRKTAHKIYRQMWGLGHAKDIVVVTESDVIQQADNPYMIIKTALEEGLEVYRAA